MQEEEKKIRPESPQHLFDTLELISKEPPGNQIDYTAALGRQSLFFLAYDILGFKDLDLNFHWDMCKEFENAGRSKLFLCPRGTFKTSIITISGAIFFIINNPNVRILITNAILDNAKAILKGIKDQFIHNDRFRLLYPEFCPKYKKNQAREFGTQEEIRVPNQKPGIRESTIEIGAVDGNLVSRHYELHIGDDLVNDKNTTTKEQINKVDSFIRAAHSLLEPGIGRDVLLGTRWHYDDPYGRILDAPDHRGYEVYVRKILEPSADGRLVSVFPERFPIKEIRRIKKKQGSYLFSSQYLNDPVSTEDQVFKEEWIERYQHVPRETINSLDIVTLIDPAVSEAKRADKTAFVTVGSDFEDGIWVLDYINRKMGPSELIDTIFSVYTKWNPRKIGIEGVAFQKVLLPFIVKEMKRRHVALPIEELDIDTRQSKDMRIRALQPRIQYYKFRIRHDMDELVDQMLRFPRCAHDDLIDALSNAPLLLRTPRKGQVTPLFSGPTFHSTFQNLQNQNKSYQKIGMHRMLG